jgi:hypothetical protein
MKSPMFASTVPRLLVPVEAAQAMLGDLGRTTVYELMAGGAIVRVKVGRRTLVTADSITAYVGRLAGAATDGGFDPCNESDSDVPHT